ncbi:MAG TPA: TlpA disulfide reductase family protein [Burkholderiales bacterium]|jgi:thiol-disulfide isomerase/thioredoxin
MTPARRKVVLGAVAVATVAAGATAGVFVLRRRSGATELLAASFPDLSGRRRKLSEWRGRPLLCNFWASWCAPCREEIPLLDSAARENASIGFQVVGIAIDNAANVHKYLKTVQVGYTVLVAEGSAIRLMEALGNREGMLPFSVTLDGAGHLRRRKLGAYSADELRADLAALLR